MGLYGGTKRDKNGEMEKVETMFDHYNKEMKGLFKESWRPELEKYALKQTADYLDRNTPGQLYGLRSDWEDGMRRRFYELYKECMADPKMAKEYGWNEDLMQIFGASPEELSVIDEDAKRFFAGEIDSKSDEGKRISQELEKYASRQIQVFLNKSGKLQKVHRSANLGAANNSKDFTRRFLGINDGTSMGSWSKYWNGNKSSKNGGNNGGNAAPIKPAENYSEDDINSYMSQIVEIARRYGENNSFSDFYNDALEYIGGIFGENSIIYEGYKYWREKVANENTTVQEAKNALESLLRNENNYK